MTQTNQAQAGSVQTDPASLILDLCARPDAGPSITPEQVARALSPDGQWQRQLHLVRKAAVKLAEAGRIEILRKGKPVPPSDARGVIRLRTKQN